MTEPGSQQNTWAARFLVGSVNNVLSVCLPTAFFQIHGWVRDPCSAFLFLEHREEEYIGTVNDPKAWIEATQDVRIAYPSAYPQAVFFVGRSLTDARFTLAGWSACLTREGRPLTSTLRPLHFRS